MIGVSTLAFADQDLESALLEIEKISSHAEIFSEKMHDIVEDFKNNPNTESLFSHTLSYSVHAPTQDVNLANPRENLRVAALETIQQSARVCQEIGAKILVVHPGYMTGRDMYDSCKAALLKSLPVLAKIQEEAGIKICVENMPNSDIYLFRSPEEIEWETAIHPIVLDIGHSNTTKTTAEFLKKQIAHYHIHDNDGKTDAHLAFGDGSIGEPVLQKIVQKAKREKAVLIAENKTAKDAKITVDFLKQIK
ncbi:sugar phosphate isomerase/epimerase family protein [Methanolapillus ohkumae]|uniref:Endonuclease 4 n=1 Tax=Methanolapillus ohkumae TaxID=3028298 RepID=A0AA96V5V1_9EURY|nr:endonuclease 4 [Methanosarcinaceae archaeon Am2]